MWADKAVFYQIYPLGFTGAPMPNDGVCVNRIQKVKGWIPHLKKLHIGAVYFSPVFESDNHGYDTRDFTKIDCRLGTNEDFKAVCDALHENGIKVVLDGVFNHVGRGFFAFRDVQEKKWDSPYKDWFHLNFDGNSAYNDGFWYEGWEGHYELVKLNLYNPTVVEYLLNCVGRWIDEFGIDGLRLDVAYMLNEDFMRRLRAYCDGKKPEFVLIGEMIHGDYNRITADGLLHSVTNYECYKGLYSAFNSMNLFEIAHSLGRQFGPEPWTLYRGKHLMNFADNHDVTRIASILNDEKQIYPLYGVLFAMPGIPCLYYGSEWGAKGEKHEGDNALRPCFDAPVENELTAFIEKLAKVKTESRALNYGDYKNITIQNKNLLFERHCDHETVFVAVNAENAPCSIDASSLEMYDCEMPSASATSFCVCSFCRFSPNRSSMICFSRGSSFSTARSSVCFSDSCSMPRFTMSGSLPSRSESRSSLPSQSTFSGSSSEISFFSCAVLRRYIRISFSMHREAYVASLILRSTLNVFTALMSPMVPMEMRSSTFTAGDSNFFAMYTTSRRLCVIRGSRAFGFPSRMF